MSERDRLLWVIERLSSLHDRASFDCGQSTLNDYLQKLAGQHDRRGVGRTYVAVVEGESKVRGYYTISSGSVAFESFPQEQRRKLPRYPIPVVHLGRLAVDRTVQGQGLGELLLVHALRRAVGVAQELGIFAVEVQALDDKARQFYRRYGFVELVDDALHMYLPMKTIRKIL